MIAESMWRIEEALLDRACNPMSDAEAPNGVPISEMTAFDAMYMLEMHQRRVGNEGRTPGRRPGPAGAMSLGDLAKEIQRGVAVVKARRKAEEAGRG